MKSRKNKIIIIMCIALLLMATGYALVSTTLTIKGTSSVTDTWGVKIMSVSSAATGRAYNIVEPVYTDTSMTFSVGVKEPGDKMTFTITIQNFGTLAAMLESIDVTAGSSDLIEYSIDGIEENSILPAGATKIFTVTTGFNKNATVINNGENEDLTIDLIYTQTDGEETEVTNTLTDVILLNNRVYADNRPSPGITASTGINFSKVSSSSNGNGLYYTGKNTEDNKTVYYFRGAVVNNYVDFAGYIWRIVRINGDGSIRLIKEENLPEQTLFNLSKTQPENAHIGYMYGTAGSSTYALTHENKNDSTIKEVLDSWYKTNLISYSSYLADAGFCNDRSTAPEANLWYVNTDEPWMSDTGLGYSDNKTYYGAYNRLVNNNTPQFACPQTNDLFTTTTSDKGNKALDYPIGLLTLDEVVYAGGVLNTNYSNANYYLYNGQYWWTMTPYSFVYYYDARVGLVTGDARVHYGVMGYDVDGSRKDLSGVRPVINLKSTVKYSSGNGTKESPYTIIID